MIFYAKSITKKRVPSASGLVGLPFIYSICSFVGCFLRRKERKKGDHSTYLLALNAFFSVGQTDKIGT